MFIITGGSRGLGAATARALVKLGKEVLIVGRRQQALEAVTKDTPNIHCLEADVASQDGQAKIIEHCQALPNIEGLIHNAGTIEPIAPIQTLSKKGWQQVLDTNLTAPLFITQGLYDQLQGARVLNIGSGAAYFAVQGWAAYCVSKAGLAMLTECFQLECPELPVAFVRPGIIDTEMQAQIRNADHQDPSKKQFFTDLKAEGGLVSAETVALFLCWLLLNTDKARYVSQHWDIYDVSHHDEWLTPPHAVPPLD